MKLLIRSEHVTGRKHTWKKASANFAHMHGVSSLAWCTKCNEEAVTGSCTSTCSYYNNEYLTQWDGENVVICSENVRDKALEKCKRHMLKVFRHLTKMKMEIPYRDVQGTTTVSATALKELRDNNLIKIVNDQIMINK